MRRSGLVRAAAVTAWSLICAGLAVAAPSTSAATTDTSSATADVRRVAAVHDRTPAQVRGLLADPSVEVGDDGRIYYVEPAPAEPVVPRPLVDRGRRPDGPRSSPPRTGAPPDDVFGLRSRPGASKVIYLDFDGHELRSTRWNNEGWPRGDYPAFSLDADRTAVSDSERVFIHEVWQRVAEDYAPFDIDVTTRDPGAAALVRSSGRDKHYGMRVLVTDSGASRTLANAVRLLCGGCAGLAWVDVFDAVNGSRYQPALVFADQLHHDPWQVAETISHEVGHTLDLVHDGDQRTAYHLGSPPWTPIMGAGAAGLSQWSMGEYPGARNYDDRNRSVRLQDDLAIIAAKTGWAADDHGDTPSRATPLGPGGALEVDGLIGRSTDRDVFALTRACSAPLVVHASPADVGANLDVRLRVLDARGRPLRDDNPPATGKLWSPVVEGLDASAELPTARGTHYLEVSGAGQRGRSGSWTSYGSLGVYRLAVTSCADGTGTGRPTSPPPPGTTPPPERPAKAAPPLRPRQVRVTRGTRGGKRSVVVRWTRARPRGSKVNAYVLRARKHRAGRVVARRKGVVKASRRRVEWRVGPGVWSVRVVARSRAGASRATPWTARVRAR